MVVTGLADRELRNCYSFVRVAGEGHAEHGLQMTSLDSRKMAGDRSGPPRNRQSWISEAAAWPSELKLDVDDTVDRVRHSIHAASTMKCACVLVSSEERSELHEGTAARLAA